MSDNPSITVRIRLEPYTRDPTLARGVQMQVRDPLWFLARQWQAGEFTGNDSGSPLAANFQVETTPLATYGLGENVAPKAPLDKALPLEVHVEREEVDLGLRASVQFGLYVENILSASGVPQNEINEFRIAYPIGSGPSSDEVYDSAALQFRALVAGRVTDGKALYKDLEAKIANSSAPTSLPVSSSTDLKVMTALFTFYNYVQALYSQPTSDSAWVSDRLHYEFEIGSQSNQGQVVLNAPEFPGGALDWYSFDLSLNPNLSAVSQSFMKSYSLLPTHITFRGMPSTKWWYFDESELDLGALDCEKVDLLKMLIAQVALVYGNDWFQLPVQVPVGTFNEIKSIVVTDSFGVQTQINPADILDQSQPRPWSFFAIRGNTGYSSFLLVPPVLDKTIEGSSLEDVLFLRDDMAEMSWAVENKLQGPLDSPVDGLEAYFFNPQNADKQSPQSVSGEGAEISYLLGTAVPENWIPMVRVQDIDKTIYFRRGVIGTVNPNSSARTTAKGKILEPSQSYRVLEQEIPKTGVEVSRYFRRTRTSDGSTFIWMARKSRIGKGPGWSGLAFDLITPAASLTKQPAASN